MKLTNKIILITGASSGIGYATAKLFAEQGANLILTARRLDRIIKLRDELQEKFKVNVLAVALDVQNSKAVLKTISSLPEKFKNIDILINNAGLALDSDPIQNGIIEHWETMIATNINGLLYLTRAILPSMIERKTGHIVNMGSIAGRHIYRTGNVYIATKHAVKAITEAIRIDTLGYNIRVTEIAPGAVHTEFSQVRWGGDKQRSDEFYSKFEALQAEDIADLILFSVTRPAHVNISEIVAYPTQQAVGTNFANS
jgi:NADP-dependent 3-hydroxy acid dehydrogenase YdfG